MEFGRRKRVLEISGVRLNWRGYPKNSGRVIERSTNNSGKRTVAAAPM